MTNGSLPPQSNPTWQNWTQSIVHPPLSSGQNYYFAPTNKTALQQVVQKAVADGATLRVSGQRHSQPPLVMDADPSGLAYLVDMSCYADLGPNGDQNIVVDAANNQVTVNTGVREDQIDEVLTQNNLMLQTVTAGGFFSVGGMTAVDVHGATVLSPIFAGTVAAYTILLADGVTFKTISATDPPVNGWSPIQFARVNLGGLGVVTSVTLNVLPRPWATTLAGGTTSFSTPTQADFVTAFQSLLQHDRVETFYNPYAVPPLTNDWYAIWWDEVANPTNKVPNVPIPATGACTLASEDEYGAPLLSTEWIAEKVAIAAQSAKFAAGALTVTGLASISSSVNTAFGKYSDLWLTEAARVMFMSYFVELPALDANGLGKVWSGLQSVGKRLAGGSPFYTAAPLEFRFVSGDQIAMSGAYTTDANAIFVNFDLIGFVEAVPTAQYPSQLLQFFADVERDWVALGGFPHNGKMYGFYDPTGPAGNSGAAFNPNFLAALRTRRGARLQAYNAYRQTLDPNGLFLNDYLKAVLGL